MAATGDPPALAPVPAPAPPPARTAWSDVVLQLTQSAFTVGGVLTLVRWGTIEGKIALIALCLSGAPALARLAGRLLPPRAP